MAPHEIETARIHFSVLDHVPIGVLVLKKDFTVLFWNACLEEWTGISRDTILGSDIRAHFPHFQDKRYRSRLMDIFQGGPPTIFSAQLHTHLIPVQGVSGKPHIQHTVVTSTPAPAASEYYALFSIQDVTDLTQRIADYRSMRDQALSEVHERRKIEAELLKTQQELEFRISERTADLVTANKDLKNEIAQRARIEEELRRSIFTLNTLIDNFPEGLLLLDSAGTVLHHNDRGTRYLKALTGQEHMDTIQEVGGIPVLELLSSGTAPFTREIEVDHSEHSVFTVSGSPIVQKQSFKGVVLVIKDITEERRRHDRMLIQERLAAVGQLAAGIAHDFNNILTGIIGFTEILLSEGTFDPADREVMEAILQNGLRAAHLVRQILDFSRKSASEMKTLDLHAFLRDFTNFIRRITPENIRIVMHCESGDYGILADPTKIQQVMTNLTLNARDAMSNGGILSFSLSSLDLSHSQKPPLADMSEGRWIKLEVSDNGTGITHETLPHIFEPFFTTKEAGKGTGLGLSQVYGILKQHGAFIDVRSTAGEGSTFTIFFPTTSHLAEAEKNKPFFFAPVGDKETILVVEDSESVRNLLIRLLTRSNFTVLPAENGQKALEIFMAHQDEIRLVLTDLVMPEMGGIDLTRRLREITPTMPIVALSGYPLGTVAEDLKKDGITECILKPFEGQTLLKIVCALLGKKSS